MTRLFVALRPPAAIRLALLASMGGVRDARWQTDNQLHLTLAFIGEVDRHGLQLAVDSLASVHRPAFTLTLGAPGCFQTTPRKRVSTLWAGVEESAPMPSQPRTQAPLPALAAAIRHRLTSAGLNVDRRRFSPHVTLARFGRDGVPVDALRRWLHGIHWPALHWPVDSFHLIESRMGAGGSHYDIVASYRLLSEEVLRIDIDGQPH